jgi:uncharacterized OB-fold protein
MEYTTESSPRRKRGIGKRKCSVCGRQFKPLSPSVVKCGACTARTAAWQTFMGWRR